MQAIADYYYIDKQLKKKQDELPIVQLRGCAWMCMVSEKIGNG